MTDLNDQSGGGEAASEVVDALNLGESEGLDPNTDNQNDADAAGSAEGAEPDPNADPEAGFEEIEFEGETFKVPPKLKDGLLRQADYTKKTQAVAEKDREVTARQQAVEQTAQRQMEFAQDIANLGALNARLQPFAQVQDWPSYIRQGGAQAQADYAEYQALTHQRDRFASELGNKVQQRQQDEQRETAKQIEASRAELAKAIPGYSADTLSKLEAVAAPYGYSSEDIRQAESDPRSVRLLHRLMTLEAQVATQKLTSTIAQGQATKPVQTLRGSAGRFQAAPERMGPAEMAKHLGYR